MKTGMDVCVLLNKATSKRMSSGTLSELAQLTKNKLYVAITRAKGNVYIFDLSFLLFVYIKALQPLCKLYRVHFPHTRLVFFVHIHSEDESQQVGNALAYLYAEQAERQRQQHDRGDEEHALPRGGEQTCGAGVAAGLEHHVVHYHPADKRERHALAAQREGADGDDLGVTLTEQGDEPFREREAQCRRHQQDDRRDLDGKPERLLDALTLARTVVEAADRLEALTEAYHR